MAKVIFETDGAIGVITLNDAPINLFGAEFVEDLFVAVEDCLASSCRAAVILANGTAFSGGANLNIFKGRTSADGRKLFERFLPMIHRLETAPFPIIAGVHGLCLAAGLELALACDMIFSAQSARYSQVEALIGATTFLGGAQRLALRCGDARAREIVFTANIYDAATFERWNIINRIIPDELLRQETIAFAKHLAAGPTCAHAVTKRMIRALCDGGLLAADKSILADAVKLYDTEDMQQGVIRVIANGARNARYGETTFKGR